MLGRLLLRLLLPGLLVLLVWRALRSLLSGIRQGVAATPPPRKAEKGQMMSRDPVCGTFVVPSPALSARGTSGTVYFCSDKCRRDYLSRA